jgi:predicted DNA-binding protein YlxM (UPF0122 family)
MSIAKLARKHHIPADTVYSRLRLGWDLEKALTTPSQIKQYTCIYQGKTLSVRQLSKQINLSMGAIYKRIERGETLQQIADNPIRHPKNTSLYVYQNKQYTLQELADQFHLNVATLYSRIKRGESIEEAVSQKQRRCKRFRQYEYNGKKYYASELAKLPECVVDFRTILNRLKLGWTVHDAITFPQKSKEILCKS